VVTTFGRDLPGNLRGMPDQSTQSIGINTDPQAIMDVIAGFSAYPQWALAVKKASSWTLRSRSSSAGSKRELRRAEG
jgi:hypothetical protein